ncbi:MAG TPA: 2-isopropylmalate synthase [Candidatus Paceibacterota bacterium]|nr:2-isopropylmalate synthase [Verrucomicrobiota bacterium]HRY50495.1 2-isopropylmalate synthase [Candidatus Paceibacterota bacterium]HSA00777.1 2-isopropylmalate synthase [Candidatus Paceibacterota bacterium]
MKTNRLIIFDTTLRDGEQCPGASMNLREKMQVARQLARLKVDVIEAGFPVISDGDFTSVRTIAREIKGPMIAGLARCVPKDIDAAAEAVKPAGRRGRIHVFLATSKIHREFKLGKAQDEILRLAVEGVKRARSYVEDVEFSPEDGSRTEPEFLVQVCRAVIGAGATTVNIPDTVGWAMPELFGKLIGRLYEEVTEFRSGKAVISVHCHNDLGLAVANSLAAVRAGARQVECTVNGIGERAGNAALEEVVMALKTRNEYFNQIGCGVNTREIVRSSRLVSRMSSLLVQRNKAIVGENAFAHASGIHQDGVLKKRETYEIMDPEEVGWGKSELPLTKHSGRAAVAARLRHLGFKLSEGDVQAIFARFKEIGDKKKFVYDDDLTALVGGHITEVPETWSLDYLSVSSGSQIVPTATVRLRRQRNKKKEPEVSQDAGTGDGPVDAALKAIDRLTKIHGRLVDYSIRAVSQGKDALGEVTVKVDFGQAKLVPGKGASTDIIEASARAYLNALNRFLSVDQKDDKSSQP